MAVQGLARPRIGSGEAQRNRIDRCRIGGRRARVEIGQAIAFDVDEERPRLAIIAPIDLQIEAPCPRSARGWNGLETRGPGDAGSRRVAFGAAVSARRQQDREHRRQQGDAREAKTGDQNRKLIRALPDHDERA